MVKHTLEPFYNSDSEILILGSLPSVKSRELGFYYMHPQNRFWTILSLVFKEEIASDITCKKNFLLKHHIALWDVIKSCDIVGSADSSIKNVKVNNIKAILKKSNIHTIYTTGMKAYTLYNKYIYPKINIQAHLLLSPSPLNCQKTLMEMVHNYEIIKD